MLSELEAHAAAKGYRMAKLDTTRQQVAAQALYIAAGYTVVGSGRVGSFETVLFQKPLP
jgi:ribosomal protein S18 acetylase RimI-like enzyme